LPTADPAKAGTPPADQILDKYIQALGGADQLSKLTQLNRQGDQPFVRRGKRRSDGDLCESAESARHARPREGDLARTFDGRDAWVMLPLTVVGEYPLNASAREGAKLDAQLGLPGGLKQFFSSWRVSFLPAWDCRDVYVVQGTGAGGLLATFYFDKQSGLLTRMIRYAASAVGRVPTQIDYSDYRPVNGVKVPFIWVSGHEEYTLTDVQPNVPVEAAKFAKPVPRAR
jgi:hypothetical protein